MDYISFNDLQIMIDLAFEPFSKGYKRCGCYVKSQELLKKHPNTHILVPLKTSEYNLEIVNAITSVTLIQTYYNPTNKFLELEYSFPINPNACVYRFTAEFGKVRIEGVVKEKEEARKEYTEAVKQGKRAALGELSSESKDVLTLKVGNVAPAQNVRVEIAYLQELSLSNNTFYQLHIPGTISPRYTNFIPGEVIAKSCRNAQLKAQGKFYWEFKISLRTSRKVVFFDSNSHDISLLSMSDTQTLAEFVMTEASVPNKDFVFTYTTEEFQLPSYVFGSTDVSSSAMLSFIPKFCSLNLDDAYKASVNGTSFEADIENARGEYVFLLDRSGSMGGSRIEKAKEALILFIKSLPQDTYFNVVSFGSGSSKLFTNSIQYSDKNVDKAVQEVRKMTADMGGTEIFNPLKTLLTGKPIDGYPKQVFLLTDGGVSNTEGVIKMVGQNNKFARVHTIAVGNGASEALILGCAKSGKGYHVFINDNENPSEKIIQLLTDSLSPVISKMQLKYDKQIVQSVIPNPESLPYILKGEIVNFYINFKGQLAQSTVLQFSYEDSVRKLPYAAEIQVEPELKSLPFVDKMGQFKKIRLMEESYDNNSNLQELMFYAKVVDKKAEIIKESVKHQILSQFTAFICVEQELVDGKYSEIKNTGQISVLVENPMPKEIESDEESEERAYVKNKKYANVRAVANRGLAPSFAKKKAIKALCRQSNMQQPRGKSGSTLDSIGGFFGNIASSISNAFSSNQSNKMMVEDEEENEDEPISLPPIHEAKQQDTRQLFMAKKGDQKKKKRKKMQEDECIQMQEGECQKRQKKREMRMQEQQLQQYNLEQFEMEEESPNDKKQVKKIVSITIDSLIGAQTTEGSWKDVSLLGRLFNKEVENRVAGGEFVFAVLTYLVAKWIEKNHPQKQYSLVIKKALNFVKKEIPNHEEFLKAYQDLVK